MDTGHFQPTKLYVRSQDSASWENESGDRFFTNFFNAWLSALGFTVNYTESYQYSKNTSKLHFDFNSPLLHPTGVRVNQIVLPNSFPTFNSTNNTLKLVALSLNYPTISHHAFDVSLSTTKRYTSYAQVAADINTQVAAVNYNFSCSEENGILKLHWASGSTHMFIVSEGNQRLGFDYPPIPNPGDLFVAAPSPIVLQPTRVVYVKSEAFGITSSYCSNNAHNIIAQIPMKDALVEYGGSIVYTNPNPQTLINLNPNNVYTHLDFELLDDDFNQIDIRRHNWSLEMSFTY
jgi:hypothetical protein